MPAWRTFLRAEEAVDGEDFTDVSSLMVVARTLESDATYRLVFSAPTSMWDDWQPVFEVILASITFNE